MTYTIAILLAFVLAWFFSLLLNAFFLLLGLRWAKVEEVNFRDAFKATIAMFVVGFILVLGYRYFFGLGERPIAEELFMLLIQVTGVLIVLRCFFATNVLRSFQALLPTTAAYAVILALMTFVFIPFIGEAFVVPTGSMAPTILGRHVETRCEQCDQPAFIGASFEHSHGQAPSACICSSFHSINVESASGPRLTGDRIIVAKFLKPKRWELAAFRLPNDQKIKYVKRLVGLPGETIHIEDGSVFANGQKLTPPEHIAGIVYSDSLGGRKVTNGTKDNPAILGPDEYFMLGDNTERALDARHWQTGAPGHNPYAVPESYIEGVVTTIYWPPERWRSFK